MACESAGLEPCVAVVLQTLGRPVLQALRESIDGLTVLIQVQISNLEAQLLVCDILSTPLTQAAGVARVALDEVKTTTALIPFGLVNTLPCRDLADFNLDFGSFLSQAFARVETVINNLDRINFVALAVGAAIGELRELTDTANSIIDCIDEILLPA